MGGILRWDTFFDQAAIPTRVQPDGGRNDCILDDLETWTAEFFEDAVFDWIGFERQI